jgi:hypothetical protein
VVWEGVNVAAVTGGVLLVAYLFERVVLPRWRPELWFRIGFPLGSSLAPIPRAPEGSGGTASVRYEVRGDRVLFWSDPARRAAPAGLHGAIRLERGPRGVELLVTWSPPWSSLLAAAWLAALGLLRGEPQVGGLLGALLFFVIGLGHRVAAVRAAAELRWAFVRDEGDVDGP